MLSVADLAGSEKVSKTGSTGQTLDEAKQINKSLSALCLVIGALSDGAAHVPYRNSKLTRVLQESLGGNSKTVLVATCSPASDNAQETHSSLHFARSAKKVKNVAVINTIESAESLRVTNAALRAEVAALKRAAASVAGGGSGVGGGGGSGGGGMSSSSSSMLTGDDGDLTLRAEVARLTAVAKAHAADLVDEQAAAAALRSSCCSGTPTRQSSSRR